MISGSPRITRASAGKSQSRSQPGEWPSSFTCPASRGPRALGDPGMSTRLLVLAFVIALAGGCHTPPLQSIDETVAQLASHPFDVAPAPAPKPAEDQPPRAGGLPDATVPSQEVPRPKPPPGGAPARSVARGPRSETHRQPATPRRRTAGGRNPRPGGVGLEAAPRQRHPGLLHSGRGSRSWPGHSTAAEVRAANSQGSSGVGNAARQAARRACPEGRSRRSAVSATAAAFRGARAAAWPERPAVHARGTPATCGHQQSGTAPGGLRCRGGQGALDPGRHLSQPDDRLREWPQPRQHGHRSARGCSSIK